MTISGKAKKAIRSGIAKLELGVVVTNTTLNQLQANRPTCTTTAAVCSVDIGQSDYFQVGHLLFPAV